MSRSEYIGPWGCRKRKLPVARRRHGVDERSRVPAWETHGQGRGERLRWAACVSLGWVARLEDRRVSRCEKGGQTDPAVAWGFLCVRPLSGKPPVLLLGPRSEVVAEHPLPLLRRRVRPRHDPSLVSVPVAGQGPQPRCRKEGKAEGPCVA